MKLDRAASIEDLARLAARRMPDFAFDFLAGGAGEDRGVERNVLAMRRVLLQMRGLQEGPMDMSVELFGQRIPRPFGVAPIGIANLIWPGTDVELARLAERESIPYTLSTAGSTDIETIAKAAPTQAWFQLYMSGLEHLNDDLVTRAANAGMRTLVVTIDIPMPSRRNRNIRQGFDMPFRWRPRFFVSGALNPRWSLATLKHGMPLPANQLRYAETPDVNAVMRLLGANPKGGVKLADVRRLRDRWKGPFLVKGILHPEDALACKAAGVDGVWVSNHGGRQLEYAPAAIDALPAIRAVVGPDYPLVFDSGIRSGEDILKAYALGANFVFCGRAFMFGAGAGSAAGVAKAYAILVDQIHRALVQTGAWQMRRLGRDWVAGSDAGVRTHERWSAL